MPSSAPAPHNPFIPGIRLVEAGDRERLFDLFCQAHRENGFGGMDARVVRDVIDRAIKRDNYVIAVVPGPNRIEAVIGLQPNRLWYGDDASWYWTELLVYTHPDYRRSRHAMKLLRFAQWFECEALAPVFVSLMPVEDFARKERLFARFGKKQAVTFLIGDGSFRYMQQAKAA